MAPVNSEATGEAAVELNEFSVWTRKIGKVQQHYKPISLSCDTGYKLASCHQTGQDLSTGRGPGQSAQKAWAAFLCTSVF